MIKTLIKNKNYSYVKDFIDNNICYKRSRKATTTEKWYSSYKSELDNDKVFSCIRKYFDFKHIFPINMQSFCNKNNPSTFCLRSDIFLKLAIKKKLEDIYLIFSCVKVENVKTYIVITSNYFSDYPNSIQSSNSFFTKDIEDLKKWSKNKGDFFLNYRTSKKIGKTLTYICWHGNENNIDKLDNYLNVLVAIPQNGYGFFGKNDRNTNFNFSTKEKEEVYKKFNGKCALLSNNSCLTSRSLNDDILKEIHHIVPRQFFRERKIEDIKIVNNINNLILLCHKCHDSLSSRDLSKRKKILENCLNVLKEKNQLTNFEDYLLNIVHITKPILYKIYGVKYD